jgi:anti-anti-sigma factor
MGVREPVSEPVLLEGGHYNAARQEDLERELCAVETHRDVVLDLARTEYIDCSCIGILIGKLRGWQERRPGAKLRLRNVAPDFAMILQLLRLDELFIVESACPHDASFEPGSVRRLP